MKKETKIEIKFIDNKKTINFDLSKNTVFFGLNGHGKTRILKTIQLLSDLGKTKNSKETLNIVNSLNLQYLKIDGVDHKGLFESSKRMDDDEVLIQKSSMRKYEHVLEYFIEAITLLGDRLNDLSDFIPPSLLNRFNNHISYNKRRNVELKDSFINNPKEFRFWLMRTKKLIQQFKILDLSFKPDVNDLIQQVDKTTSFLLDEIFISNNFYIDSDRKLREELELQKKDIIDNLGSIKVHYISTENIHLEVLTQKIKKDMNNSKDIIFSSLFNFMKENSQEKVRANSINLKIIEKSVVYFQKSFSQINELNKVLKKYCPITLNLDELSGITFIKDKKIIEFCKLSSGEQRIIFIFFNMIFFEADIYLIDEPELSLSIDYQNKIVTDLISLSENNTLMIATHAPFIFEDFKNLENTNIKEV